MIHCIVLAAGFGRRFAGDKLNADVDGKPMYRHVLDLLTELSREGLCDVRVVTRRGALSGCDNAVFNDRAEEGVSSSIRCGLDALPDDGLPTAFFVADQPFLKIETVRGFLRAYDACGKGILCAAWNGRGGNPVLFHRKYEAELRSLQGDVGGKAVLRRHTDDAAYYQVSGERELEDLDHNTEIGGRA